MNVVPQINDTTITNEFLDVLYIFLFDESHKKSDLSIFTYPVLHDSQIMIVKKMIHDGVSISGCCRFLSSYFQFDPALLNALIKHEIPHNEEKIAIISSLIAWVGSDKNCTSSFFLLFIQVINSYNPSPLFQFCLRIIIDHYTQNIPHELSYEAISLLTHYFIENNEQFLFSLDILNSFLKISIKIKQSDVINLIFNTLSIIIRDNDFLLSNYDFTSLLQNCHSVIDSLSIDLLSILTIIAETSQYTDDLNKWFELLAQTIIETFSKSGTPFTTKSQTPTEKLWYDFVIDYQISFESFKYYQQALDSLQYASLEPSINVSEVLTTRQFEILNSFRTLLQIRQKKYVKTFFLKFLQLLKNTKQCIETALFFVYLVCYISDFEIPQSICEDLINLEFFSPRFTIFYSDKDEFQVFNLLRNLTIGFIMKYYPIFFTIVLENCLTHPFLFTETIARLHTVIPIREASKIVNETIISDISTVFNTIMIKMSENIDDDLRKHVFSVWSTLFVSVNEFLSDTSLLVLLFSSYEFLNVFLRHFFDPSLRSIIFSTLRRHLVNPDAYLHPFAQFCLHFFNYAICINNEKLHAIMTELLAIIEDAIIHRPEILTDLSMITPAILSFFLHFPTKELLKNTLNFLLHVSFNIDNFTFSTDEMLALGNTIRSMENNGVSDQTFSIMLSLLAGTKISSLSTNFAIKNPSYILLIMYISADDISQTVQFFYRLCRYSIFNCLQCQIGKLDLLLIEHVKNYPKPFRFFDCTFNSTFSKEELSTVVLQLLSLIFTYQCSPQSIERFIGLAVPLIDTKVEKGNDNSNLFKTFRDIDVKYPLFADNIMNQLITTTTNQHEIRYVFTSSATPIIFGSISLFEMSEGMTFSCFLIVDTAISVKKSDKPILFKISDNLNNVLILYLSGTTLLCEIRSTSSFSSISLTTEFPSCEWSMLTLVVRKKNDQLLLLDFAINENLGQPFTVHDSYFTGHILKAQIGGFLGSNQHSTANIFSCLLGPYQLLNVPLDETQIGSLYSIGMKSFEGTSIRDLFAKVGNSTDLSIKSFLTVFRKYGLVKNFVPFFCFSTQAPPFFIEKVVDFLHKAEIHQYEDYLSIISQFLMTTTPSVITYSLYLRFYSLFIEKQSTELFKHILFNFDIWFNAEDPLTVKRTVQHWNNVLFTGFSQTFLEATTFSEILTLIRIHCYFKNDEVNLINTKRCKSIDVNVIRNALNHLLSKFASCRLELADVRSLLSNIFTSHDIQNVLSLLNLLDQISSQIPDKAEVVNSLHFLFTTQRPALFSATLNLLLKFSIVETNQLSAASSTSSSSSFNSRMSQPLTMNKSIESTKSHTMLMTQATLPQPKPRSVSISGSQSTKMKDLDSNIEYVMFHMNNLHWTSEILDAAINVSKNYPEALPLTCLIACNLTKEEMLKTINLFATIITDKEHQKNNTIRIKKIKTWFVWPIILTLKVQSYRNYQILMMNTIVSIMKNDFDIIDSVLAFLDLIYIHYGISVIHFQYAILDLLSIELLKNPVKISADTLYRFVRYLLFHFDCETHSQRILQAYDESPFSDNKKVESSDEQIIDLNNMNDLVNLFSSAKTLNTELRFRVDNNDNHIQLFTKILKNIDRLISIDQDYESLNGYVQFLKYLINKPFFSEEEKFQAVNDFACHYHAFQTMTISFKKYFNKFTNDFEQFLIKTKTISNNLLTNLNEEIIRISLTSVDLLHERNELQYARDVNLFNEFESLIMNEFSIWGQFSPAFSFIENKSFKILENFSSVFMKTNSKVYQIQLDVFTEHEKPLFKKHCTLIHFTHTQTCTFAILSSKIMIVTDFKCINIHVNDITYILYRSYNCFEFVKKNGKTYLVYFEKIQIEDVLKPLKQMGLPVNDPKPIIQSVPASKFFNSLSITTEWVNRKLTNFEYLLKLNFLCGRTYQMISNYPIFPFIRDFSLNVGYNFNPFIYLKLFTPFQKFFRKKTTELPTESDFIPLNSAKLLTVKTRTTPYISNDIIYPKAVSSFTSSSNYGADNVRFDYSSDCTISTNQEDDEISSLHLSSFELSSHDNKFKYNSSDEIHLTDSFLTIYQLNKYELTPEFYDMPECFESLKLPDGITSCHDFIYQNRKQLESEVVSKTLHIWIDRIFGHTGLIPIFKTSHPIRNSLSKQNHIGGVINKDYKLFLKITVKNAHYGKIVNPINEKDKVVLKIISMPDNYSVVHIDLLKKSIELSTEKKMKISSRTLFSYDGEDILVLDLGKEKIYSIQGFMMGKPIHSTAEFAESESLFGTSDGFIFAVQTNHHKISTLGICKVSPQLIVASTSSKQFNRTAVSTQNGEILIFDRTTGRYISSINTNGKTARRLLFTQGFGFLIAEFPFELALYSLSGQLIRTVKIDYEVLYMSSFKSEDGFDYLVLLNNLGHINIFEAFTLEIIERSSHKINCSILDTIYAPSIHTLLILTQDGKLFSFA